MGLSNPTRGCGHLKPGGCYASGAASAGGSLSSWSWLLGSGILGGENLPLKIPPRQMLLGFLRETLTNHHLSTSRGDFDARVRKLPEMALFDHIGSSHYTPWSFAQECRIHGASRRIPEAVARQIAPYTPLPIVFTHSWMPLVDAEYRPTLLDWATGGDHRESYSLQPTWLREGFGLTVRAPFHGEDHWLIPVLKMMDEVTGGKERPFHTLFTPELSENVLDEELAVGVSWITKMVYIQTGDETQGRLQELLDHGITPVEADEET